MGLRLLALACLVGAAFAGPFQRETGSRCATHCPNHPHPKFDYELGKKYVYEYRGENFITIAGQRKQKATIEGLAEFHVMTKCEAVLRLKNVRIQQKLSSEEIQELLRKLEIPVSYSFDDGKVDHVCPNPEETQLSLNIKKGVISTMVNNMTKLDAPQNVKEVDSLGSCVTKYTVKYSHGLEIRKEKNLKSCTNRHTSVTSLITSPYDSPDSKIHTLPIFPEEYLICKQFVEDKIIKKVECTEKAQIKPMKHRDSVIQFEGTIHLHLLSKDPVDLPRLQEPKGQETILYNLEESKDTATNEKEVEHVLREMCSKNVGVIDVSVSKDFIKLVTLVKTLPYNSLDRIHRSLKDGKLCSSKKVWHIFVDALPMAGSEASVKLMVQLLENHEVKGLKAKIWPASLALIPRPTQDTVDAVIPLLRMEHSAPVLLGVSAMVHRFCSMENCERVPSVQQIVSILNEQLGHRCSSDKNDEVFATLKAFGNMGYYGQAKENIIACAKDSTKPTRQRLAAIDAFRRSEKKRPQELLDMYADQKEHFEIRIAALSSVMKKAEEHQLRDIKRIAEQETDNQVSGYAYSLIKNMNKTSSPLKKNLKQLLQKIEINPPKVSYWENSKNIELSAFSEFLNIGGSAETDLIHAPESKIPRSLYSRFDVDIFDKSMNLFEVGVRAEGLEELIKKLIGLKDKVPKMPSWNLFNSENIIGDTQTEASLFLRTMNTEIFDISASDLSGIGEMIKIAEIMEKLAQGRDSDFAHSFLFLNSKLVIPSVTGRSYSIDLTGSATVGLTASSKFNLLSFPRSADVHLHFQPSVNVEISTTVGILSNKHRPDLKLVSSMHLESDMDSKFHIKDGHVALASVSLPSENVILAKISSDVIEIDDKHNEKRVFDKMQKKIDYCFRHLEKPLGVSLCGKLEVPKPFVTKTFPYIHAIGNVEFALKKTDNSFNSYEISLEIPKNAGSEMKYKAYLDTPRSHVPRRFAAELEVKQQGNDHKKFSLELTSPFKNAGGSGSYTWREELVQGSWELHSSSSRLFTANFSTEIASSRSRKVLKPSLEVSFSNKEPVIVDGTISIIQGRKQQISIDMKANKPRSRPMTLKGIIMKEGQFELSRKADWKLSSDLAVQSPFADAQIRSAVEKRSKQSQTISTSFSADYQRRGMEKHSVQFAGLSQKSLDKMNTNIQFETSQFSSANWSLNWDMQGDSLKSSKNDITVKYGRDPEQRYVIIKHRSRMPENERGDSKLSVKAPQFHIDSELTITHEIQLGVTPKLHLAADLLYKTDKHIKSLLDVHYESRSPLKANSRWELEYPGRKVIYWDQVEETSRNNFEGKSNFQYAENKQIELKYKYQKLSEQSKIHHELETALQIPSFQAPIKSKASVRLSEGALSLEGHSSSRNQFEYSVEANVNSVGATQFTLKAPQVEGMLSVTNEESKKLFDIDLQWKTRTPRHIRATALAELKDKHKFLAEVLLDADRYPEKKIHISTVVEVNKRSSGDIYTSGTKLQIFDIINISLAETGEISLRGNIEANLEADIRNLLPISLAYRQQLSEGHVKSEIKFAKNHVQKAEAVIEGNMRKNGNQREFSAKATLKSPDNSFENMDFSMTHEMSRAGSSNMMKSQVVFQKSLNKIYKAEWMSDLQSEGIEIKAQLQTPDTKYQKQSVGISFLRSSDAMSSSMKIEMPHNKEISVSSEFKKKSQGLSVTLTAESPFDIIRNVKVHVTLDNHRSKKALLSYIDVNNARMCDLEVSRNISSSGSALQGQFKMSPIPNVNFQGFDFIYQRNRNLAALSGKVELLNSKHISITSEIKKDRYTISATGTINSPLQSLKNAKVLVSIENQSNKKNLLFFVDANEQRKCDLEVSVSSLSKALEIQGRMKSVRTPEVSGHMKFERSGESYTASANVLRGPSYLRRSSEMYGMKNELEKTVLDFEFSKEVSGDNTKKYSVRARGPFSPISLTVASSQNEKSSLGMEITACREEQRNICYSVKSHHNAMVNSGSYRIFKKITIDLEKSTDDSVPENMGSAQFLLSAAEHNYRSNIILKLREKKVGYEVRVHRQEHKNDHCSFESEIFMLHCTSSIRATMIHQRNHLALDVEATPNTSEPSRKSTIELKKDYQPEASEHSIFMKINDHRISKPTVLTIRVQKHNTDPIQGKMELRYGLTSEKILTFEATPDSDRSSSGRKAISYRLYREDKSLDASLQLMKQNTREKDMYGYEWSYESRKGQKKGGVSILLSQKKSGRPQNVNILYFTPSVNLKIEGQGAQIPSEASLTISSHGQIIKEIRLRTRDSCLDLEVARSEPIFKSSLCLNKREERYLHLVSLDAHYQRQKCLDLHVGFEPENPTYIDVVLQWKKKELGRALGDLSGLNDLLKDQSLAEIEHELRQKVNEYKNSVIWPTLRKSNRKVRDFKEKWSRKLNEEWVRKLEQTMRSHSKMLKEHIQNWNKLKEYVFEHLISAIPWSYVEKLIEPLREVTKCFLENYFQIVVKHVPDFWKLVWNVTKTQWEHCMKKFCTSGTFCHEFVHTYQRQGLKQTKVLIQKRIFKTKRSIEQNLLKLQFPDIVKWISKGVSFIKQKLETTFGKILGDSLFSQIGGFLKSLEKQAREKAIQTFDQLVKYVNGLFGQAEKDEDFRTAKSLVLDAQNKLTKAWRNKEELAAKSWKQSQETVMKSAQKVIDQRLEVRKFDTKGGDISLKVRSPFGPSQLEIIRNEIQTVKRRLQQSVSL